MAALGDSLSFVRRNSVAIPILVALSIPILWFWWRPLNEWIYVVGVSALCIAAAIPLLPRIDSGYEQTYWLGTQRYSIPWQYAPRNGSKQPGGKFFIVEVRGPDLTPAYSGRGEKWTIKKAVVATGSNDGTLRIDNCDTSKRNSRCEWKRGLYVYSTSTAALHFDDNPEEMMQSVEKLLAGFQVESE